jgi:hypothetical protein
MIQWQNYCDTFRQASAQRYIVTTKTVYFYTVTNVNCCNKIHSNPIGSMVGFGYKSGAILSTPHEPDYWGQNFKSKGTTFKNTTLATQISTSDPDVL